MLNDCMADKGIRVNVSVGRKSFASFGLLVVGSLFLTAMSNRAAGTILTEYASDWGWLATAAIPSVSVIAVIYAIFGNRSALDWPKLGRTRWRNVLVVSALWIAAWLTGTIVAALSAGRWITYASGGPLVAAFVVFGPLGEELLFRGLLFERAHTIWQGSPAPAMWISTIAFSFHHVALASAPHGLAAAQVLFTIPMGFVFALLRERTGSIWPGFVLHVLTNLPAIF
jgi:membrane protease YdiL (CAAX protease family)